MSSHQTDRACAKNYDLIARLHSGKFSTVPAGREDVRQHDVVVFLLLRVLGQLQAVRVAERYPQILGLAAVVRAHTREPVGRPGHVRVGVGSQTESRQPLLAIATEAATDIERQADPITHLHRGHGGSYVDDFAEVLMAEDPASVHRGAALVHVEVGSADVCGGDPDEYIGGLHDDRVRNVLDADLPGPFVNNSFHDLSQSQNRAAPATRANRAADAALSTECADAQHPVATLPEFGCDIFVLPGRLRGASLAPARR